MTDPTLPGLPDDLADDRSRSLEVPCPSCGQPAGTDCRRADGKPLERLPAHPKRMRDAGIVHAPLDTRDLRASHERTPR